MGARPMQSFFLLRGVYLKDGSSRLCKQVSLESLCRSHTVQTQGGKAKAHIMKGGSSRACRLRQPRCPPQDCCSSGRRCPGHAA